MIQLPEEATKQFDLTTADFDRAVAKVKDRHTEQRLRAEYVRGLFLSLKKEIKGMDDKAAMEMATKNFLLPLCKKNYMMYVDLFNLTFNHIYG